MTPVVRFFNKIEVQDDGCWVWTASTDKDGYGWFWLNGQQMKSARAAHILFIGPIPGGYEVDHLCFVPSCVNPAHLEAVTHQENLRRRRPFVSGHARKTQCPSGHPYDEVNTRTYRGRRFCRQCQQQRVAA